MRNNPERRRRKRERWFKLGAEAVQRIWPELPYCYMCPLCGPTKAFLPSALNAEILTFEHAPPKSVGGKEVALTCRICNNTAGAGVDVAMLSRAHMLDLALGTMEGPIRGHLEIAGERLVVDYQHGGNSVLVWGLPTNNKPDAQDRLLDRLAGASSSDGFRFNITPNEKYNHRKALIGGLKSAYLIAFAALGYRYIFRSALDIVRAQLAELESESLRCFSITVPDADPKERQIMIVQEPEALRSLAVQMGRTVVFLPSIEIDYDIYGHLSQGAAQSTRLSTQLCGKVVAWPKGPVQALDYLSR